jgi:hypothetical protein
MTSLADKALALDEALTTAGTPHAFGGALALAFHIAEPRGTRDIDLNIFVPTNDARAVLDTLPNEVQWTERDVEQIQRDGQVRVFWADTPVDLFFDTHPFHQLAATHTELVPFAGRMIPILAADDLAVFKAFFDRTKDWADIEAMIDVQSLDVHVVLGWLVDLLGGGDHRVTRLRGLIERGPQQHDPRFAP